GARGLHRGALAGGRGDGRERGRLRAAHHLSQARLRSGGVVGAVHRLDGGRAGAGDLLQRGDCDSEATASLAPPELTRTTTAVALSSPPRATASVTSFSADAAPCCSTARAISPVSGK